jgi:hypothetical protein
MARASPGIVRPRYSVTLSAETTDYFQRGDELSRVPRRVLGGVRQEADDGGRQRCPADGAALTERRGRGPAELVERATDRSRCLGGELADRLLSRLTLSAERGELIRGEPLAARVREQPVEAPGQVPKVESRRRGAAGADPEVGLVRARGSVGDVLAGLDQRVRGRHERERDVGQRTAKPRLGWGTHGCNLMAEKWRRTRARPGWCFRLRFISFTESRARGAMP